MEAMERIRELTDRLNEAAKAYYSEDREIISNLEYDKLYDELAALEEKTGVVLSGSPTMKVGYEALSELPKEEHEVPMLSLDKTKQVEELREWLKDKEALLSWKLDGLTVVLTYHHGELVKAVTRGNGVIGEVITNNARTFQNIPLKIQYQGELILRGEAVIRYSDFEKINAEIENPDDKYKNPRNLCSGSVRQLNNQITAKRNVNFFAFALVRAEEIDFENSVEKQFQWLSKQGFQVVEYEKVTKDTVAEAVQAFADRISDNDVPSDGLVVTYDDIAYGISLGRTAKFPRNAIAFKWADEMAETKLQYIEWSASRTGLINPVAVFDPVELEGTTVSRASVHNVSVLRALQLGIGDIIKVYKANMIIPQIAENITKSNSAEVPEVCPVCGGSTEIRRVKEGESLYCVNPQCQAKRIKAFTLFVSRDALNIEGLSESTLEKFVDSGFIKNYADIFRLDQYKEAIVTMEGFGERSYQKLMESLEKAKKTTMPKLLYGLGISNVGLSTAKLICAEIGDTPEALMNAKEDVISGIVGIGEVIAKSFCSYFQKEENCAQFMELCQIVTFEEKEQGQNYFEGMIFVITGSVEQFANRSEMKEFIEKNGGKVTGSVTSKTTYLINNDKTSASSKNKKAQELNIPIISEQDMLDMTK
ncbi:MAG: NAD-dependent DNA ligase LigA [Lachnospiraceae bacterium]|nr:NAD-dependent DNA ligase LigA [Lachnospiraceae bacterium]